MNAARRFEALIVEHGAMVARICSSYESDPEWLELAQAIPPGLARAAVVPRRVVAAHVRRLHRAVPGRFARRRARSRAGEHRLDESAAVAPGPLLDAQAIAADQRELLPRAVRRLPIAYGAA